MATKKEFYIHQKLIKIADYLDIQMWGTADFNNDGLKDLVLLTANNAYYPRLFAFVSNKEKNTIITI